MTSSPPGSPDTTTTRRRITAINEFLSVESLAGVVLLLAVLAALVWANAGATSYEEFWSTELTLGIGDVSLTETLRHWVTEGLMSVFFFVVGLEIKREIVRGELRDPRTAALPVLAAVGGMAVPALLFTLVNLGTDGSQGWGVPVATDIAFAVAVLVALGDRVPRTLKLFLLTLAIADDIGGIVVIALFYSQGVEPLWLLGTLGVAIGIVGMRRLGVSHPLAYVVPGFALWLCLLESGVHAAIAGVVLGLLTPAGSIAGRPVIEALEHRLHPWTSLVVVPLFALASAGVVLDVASLERAFAGTVTWGVILGLVVGKPVGILLATVVGVATRLVRLPAGVGLDHVAGAGAVAGIGFTVSLFIADLSFTGDLLADAKIGILVASVTSAVVGAVFLAFAARRHLRPGRDRAIDATS